jgi:alpha-glucosidase
MKKSLLIALVYLNVGLLAAQTSGNIVASPDKNIIVRCDVKKAIYNISFRGKTVLKDSKLGVVREDEDFSGRL